MVFGLPLIGHKMALFASACSYILTPVMVFLTLVAAEVGQ